jgi:hypothetical protein
MRYSQKLTRSFSVDKLVENSLEGVGATQLWAVRQHSMNYDSKKFSRISNLLYASSFQL